MAEYLINVLLTMAVLWVLKAIESGCRYGLGVEALIYLCFAGWAAFGGILTEVVWERKKK